MRFHHAEWWTRFLSSFCQGSLSGTQTALRHCLGNLAKQNTWAIGTTTGVCAPLLVLPGCHGRPAQTRSQVYGSPRLHNKHCVGPDCIRVLQRSHQRRFWDCEKSFFVKSFFKSESDDTRILIISSPERIFSKRGYSKNQRSVSLLQTLIFPFDHLSHWLRDRGLLMERTQQGFKVQFDGFESEEPQDTPLRSVCTRAFLRMCMYLSAHVCRGVCVRACMHLCACLCHGHSQGWVLFLCSGLAMSHATGSYACVHVCVCTRIHVRTYSASLCIKMWVCICACVRAHICVHMHVLVWVCGCDCLSKGTTISWQSLVSLRFPASMSHGSHLSHEMPRAGAGTIKHQ